MRKPLMNKEGVSPVIGVILMVAITVILAAVIAIFIFGPSGSDPNTGVERPITIDNVTVSVTKIENNFYQLKGDENVRNRAIIKIAQHCYVNIVSQNNKATDISISRCGTNPLE